MPELPEVETVVTQLKKFLIGKKIQSIDVRKEKSWRGNPDLLIGAKILTISRRSKMLRIHFSNHRNVLIHLKMSGQLLYVEGDIRVGGGHPTADWVDKLPSSHTRVIFTFSDNTKLFFNDQRMFGWVRFAADKKVEEEFAKLAPDIIDPIITPEYLFAKIHHRRVPIKQLIMDNTIVAGVGNIYACDALNLARISPLRSAATLSLEEAKKLVSAMKKVIRLGIEKGGATVHGKYVNVHGLAGKYQDFMRVYSRAGKKCPNCGAKIVKIKLAGRGTFYCPECQK
jgi:formamidopyrimidine-DNA glycosylase